MTLKINLRKKKRSVVQKPIPTIQAYLCISVSRSVILNVSKSDTCVWNILSIESNVKNVPICHYS